MFIALAPGLAFSWGMMSINSLYYSLKSYFDVVRSVEGYGGS